MDISTESIIPEFIFGDDRPFLQCHASTLVRLSDGRFLIAWFGGTKEKDDDVGIWITKGNAGTWAIPQEVAKIRHDAHWNPVLFQPSDGKIILYFKVGKEIARWQTWFISSEDDGESWSAPRELVAGDRGGRGPVRNKPIVLSDGRWIAGASHESGPWEVFFDVSSDQGETWQPTPYISLNRDSLKGKGIIQPTLWESSPGKVHALLRSSEGVVYRTDSEDYGISWSEAYPTSLPNPNSAIDLVRFDDGTLVLAYNPDDENWGSRGTLSLAVSADNGRTWNKKIDLASGEKDEEFSYPAIIRFGDSLAVTYTWNRNKIAFHKLALTDLVEE